MKLKLCVRFVLFIWIINFPASSTYSQSKPSPVGKTALLDQFVLARTPVYMQSCDEESKRDAVLVFPTGTPPPTAGDEFRVLTHNGQAVSGKITTMLPSKFCKDTLSGDPGISFALLSTQARLAWDDPSDAMVAVRAEANSSNHVGTALTIGDARLYAACMAIIKPTIPSSERFQLFYTTMIVPPESKEKLYFLSLTHINKARVKSEGDKATYPKGYLFAFEKGKPHLLLAEKNLATVFTVSDLDLDGKYEMMVFTGGYGRGAYEVRVFDGHKFTRKKTLYSWKK